MTSDIVPIRTPEEEELERKRAELASLESQYAERELELATLRAELDRIEHAYMSTVGVKYAELDRIEAEIAELLAAQNPNDTEAADKATEARQQARESAQATDEIRDEPIALERFVPSASLKNLYREAAKQLHPDFAEDEEDRVLRTRLMAEVNKAYSQGDEDRIREILREWEMSPESVKGEGTMADLARVIRKIALFKRRMSTIDGEFRELMASQAYALKERLEEASAEGRDLLTELASRIETDIQSARLRLTVLRDEAGGKHQRA